MRMDIGKVIAAIAIVRRESASRSSHGEAIKASFDRMCFRLRRALAFDPPLHARLNAETKQRKAAGEPRRPLMGLHDVDTFIETVFIRYDARWPDAFKTERAVTLKLIAETEKKGGRKAALRVCYLLCAMTSG